MGEVMVVEVSAVVSGDPRGALGATRLVVGDTKILPKKLGRYPMRSHWDINFCVVHHCDSVSPWIALIHDNIECAFS